MFRMNSVVKIASLILISAAAAQSAFAMSARECVAQQRELSETVVELQTTQQEIAALAEQAELAGDEYVSAQEMSGWSDAHLAEAQRLEVEFNTLRDEVHTRQNTLAFDASQFNQKRAVFQEECAAYFVD